MPNTRIPHYIERNTRFAKLQQLLVYAKMRIPQYIDRNHVFRLRELVYSYALHGGLIWFSYVFFYI